MKIMNQYIQNKTETKGPDQEMKIDGKMRWKFDAVAHFHYYGTLNIPKPPILTHWGKIIANIVGCIAERKLN